MAFLLLVGVVIKFVGMHADIEMENDSNKKGQILLQIICQIK